MPIPFVHLHCHSHYSSYNGTASPDELVKRAKELDMPALALTDFYSLQGVPEFCRAAKSHGIKPILGAEVLVDGFGLTLLAVDQPGWKNLVRISTMLCLDKRSRGPELDKKSLQEYSGGLICLSGFASGELARFLAEGESGHARAKSTASWFLDVFGDRYYLELRNHGIKAQESLASRTAEIGKELGIPTVATNDIHYLEKEDWKIHDLLLCLKNDKLMSDQDRPRMDSQEHFFRTGMEMSDAMPDRRDAVERTLAIADRIDPDLFSDDKKHHPVFPLPPGKTDDLHLRELCLAGLEKRYADGPRAKEAKHRLNSELAVLQELGLANYFLIVADIIRFAEERKIYRTARASGAGSLICYVLNISHVCPLEHDLLFERYLGADPQDIDIDFDRERREEIINYVKSKYGEECVAQTAAFGMMQAKRAIKDVGMVLDMPIPFVESITTLIPGRWKISIKLALEESDELRRRYDTEADVRTLVDLAVELEGTYRYSDVHACACAVSDRPLVEDVPLQYLLNNSPVTQWQRNEVENASVLVLDFFGLQCLTFLARIVDLLKETKGETIDPYTIPSDDPATFDLLNQAETDGVFQLKGEGMREFLRRLKPNRFHDIIAALALYRPGPLEGGMLDRYVDVKKGLMRAEYLHPAMEEILTETYGVIVYQEQVMRILEKIGAIPLEKTYDIIKAIYKNRNDLIERAEEDFLDGASAKGIPRRTAKKIFEQITKFARYGFNKSHAATYARIAYMTAYLKAHYPEVFAEALFLEHDS